jgi:hypothetical protein
MNHLDKDKNIPVLISALEERYRSIHTIRDRVQNIGIWSLGIMLSAGGFIFQSDITMNLSQKSIFIIGLVIAFWVLRFEYLEDLHKGFKAQQKVAARIENILGFFESGVFDKETTSVYPEGWINAGKEKGGGKFFSKTYLLIVTGTLFLIAAIIFNGCFA